ncbi:MAG: hypothetical protein AAFQ67_02405, partial [Pseudomonadota bacterium]
YRPGFVSPGSATAAAGLVAPELQIIDASTTIGFINTMSEFVRDDTRRENDALNTFTPDYSEELALAETPTELAEHLSDKLTSGRLPQLTKDRIIGVVNEVPIDPDDPAEDRETRVHLAILMVISSPEFTVQR